MLLRALLTCDRLQSFFPPCFSSAGSPWCRLWARGLSAASNTASAVAVQFVRGAAENCAAVGTCVGTRGHGSHTAGAHSGLDQPVPPPTYALNSCVRSSVWTFSCLTDLLGSPIFIARERDINFQLKVFKPDSLPHLERWVSCLRVTTPAWMIPEDPTLWGNRPSTPAPWDVLTPSFCLIVSSHGSKPKPLFKQFFLSSFPFFHCF